MPKLAPLTAFIKPSRTCWLALLLGLSLSPARADWSRQTVQTLQQTTGNRVESTTLQPGNLTAVAGSGLRASAPLIEQGQWNPTVTFSPAVDGGAFSLQHHAESAGAEASRSLSISPNRLGGEHRPDGSLRGGPGQAASELKLTILQTYSVF
jgi:hypothetical protein